MPNAKLFLIFCSILPLLSVSQTKKVEPSKGLVLYIPENFTLMSDDNLAQKYPTYKKPIAMYESRDKKAEMGVNAAVNTWRNNNLNILKDMYKSTIASVFAEVDFIQDGTIVEVNGRKFVYFEFTSAIKDDKRIDETTIVTRRYNYLAYTIYANRILVFNFNSTYISRAEWTQKAVEIMKSIKVSDKLKLDKYVPFQAAGPQPKEISGRKDMQMEALKKLNGKK